MFHGLITYMPCMNGCDKLMIPSMQMIMIMYHEFFLLLQVDVQYLQQHDLLFKKMHDEIMQFSRQAPYKKIGSIPEIKKFSLKGSY